VRLLVSVDGRPTIECTPHLEETRVWRVDFAQEPVDEFDPFILHKTTRREVYENARRSRPDVDDVLLWNGRGEVTESTIANLVAELDDVRYTPPISCGLLGGMFRAEQLDAGTIRERVLTKSAIASASRLWLINSVRGWVDAELQRARSDH
jgi:para-aminobenzoate synthetase/4-amino-4-deoxychorismate lyase